jgi:hypothetical protein
MAPSTEECGGRSVRDADRRDTDLLSSRGVRRRVRSPEASRQARERSGDGPLQGAAALWPDAPGRGSPFGARRPCSSTTAARTPSSARCGTASTRTSRRRGGYENGPREASRGPSSSSGSVEKARLAGEDHVGRATPGLFGGERPSFDGVPPLTAVPHLSPGRRRPLACLASRAVAVVAD